LAARLVTESISKGAWWVAAKAGPSAFESADPWDGSVSKWADGLADG